MAHEQYTTRDVAEVLGVDEAEIGRWVRGGVIRNIAILPSRGSTSRNGPRLFSFADLVALKAAKELMAQGVSLSSVRRNLAALESALPNLERGAEGPALARLRVVSDGQRLMVVGDDAIYEPLSGQVVMDFMVGTLRHRAAEVLSLSAKARRDTERSAYDWFLDGCELDRAGLQDAAEAAFSRALHLDPTIAAAHTNLGNLAHRKGRRGDARTHYERALALDPDQPEARFNLGNLLEELGEPDAAMAAWTRVAALTPGFADAHFNLGAAQARHGQPSGARAALERYLTLDESGTWAEAARDLLGALAQAPASHR